MAGKSFTGKLGAPYGKKGGRPRKRGKNRIELTRNRIEKLAYNTNIGQFTKIETPKNKNQTHENEK